MKNRAITIIIILFSVMLVGIIGVQAWWIKRSLQLNKQQFTAAVYRSLESVVRQAEQKENYKFVRNNMGMDSLLHADKKHLSKVMAKAKAHAHTADIIENGPNNISVVSHNGKTVVKVEHGTNGNSTYSSAQSFVINTNDNE
ncbi:MAG TPA: hypothetical protein VNY36_08305, partial [Bacteroidia bacterium]|nr:hypothetical protein [Bacteroidia bacterium]